MAANTEREIQSSFCDNSRPIEGEGCTTESKENFKHIKDMLAKCTEKCFAPARLKKVSSCLPKVREKNPAAFESIVKQCIEHLKVNVKQELDLMFQQENLVSLCHQLDQITKASTDTELTEATWRPSGVPSEDIKDHVIHVKLELREKLREKLTQLQDENQVLKNNLTLRGKEIAETELRIIEEHKELQKISTVCDDITSYNNNEGRNSLENIIQELQK